MMITAPRKLLAVCLAVLLVATPIVTTPAPADARWFDQETGLIYYNARYYHPALGRFMSADPNGQGLVLLQNLPYHARNPVVTVNKAYTLQYGDGMNFYEYLRSNPGNRRDPSGLFSLTDLGAASGIQSDMIGNYIDMAFSAVDAMKGIIFMANERNAQMDTLLGVASDPFDTTAMDDALALHNAYQTASMALFGGNVVGNLLKAGGKLWNKFARRAGGRHRLLNAVEGGIESQRSLYGFQSRFWTKRTTFNGKRVYQRDDLINPHFVGPDGRTNLQRMQEGLSPIGPDGRSINLHHLTQMNDSPLAEVTSTMHASNKRALHINPDAVPSGIDRPAFNEWRKEYWIARARDFR